MNNLDATQTIGSELAANDASVRNVDSSVAMIPPAGAENPNEDDELWNWVAEARMEEFHLDDLNFPTLQKPPEFWNNASQLPREIEHRASSQSPWAQFLKQDAAKLNAPSPELRSLILWQSENVGFKGDVVAKTVQAQGMQEDNVTIINPPVGGEMMGKNRKRKGIEVDDNYENNAQVPRRGSLTASQAVAYHDTRPGKKSNYSINDKLMALQALVPGSQKADMATTLGETVEYLTQVKMREQLLQEEVKQLRQAIGLTTGMRSSVHNCFRSPLGTPLNMGVHTQLGGMEFRPLVHPKMNLFNSVSARMNMPSVMPSLLQQNSASAASRLFVPPQVPAPNQQQRIVCDKIDDTQGPG